MILLQFTGQFWRDLGARRNSSTFFAIFGAWCRRRIIRTIVIDILSHQPSKSTKNLQSYGTNGHFGLFCCCLFRTKTENDSNFASIGRRIVIQTVEIAILTNRTRICNAELNKSKCSSWSRRKKPISSSRGHFGVRVSFDVRVAVVHFFNHASPLEVKSCVKRYAL